MRIPLPPKPMPVIVATLDGKHSAQAEAFIQSAIEDARACAIVRMELGTAQDGEPYERVVENAVLRFQRFDGLKLRWSFQTRGAADGRTHLRVTLTTTGEKL